MKVVQTMKKKMAFLFGLLFVLTYLSAAVAEKTVTPADQPFQNEAVEQAHLIAQEKLKKRLSVQSSIVHLHVKE